MRLTTITLTRLGLVALALSATTDTGSPPSVTGPTTFLENTQTQKYHCEGKDVVRCETTAEGACIAMDPCEAYCFIHNNGSACADMGEPPVAPKVAVSASDAEVATRDVLSQKNEHNECSKDRTGVLICRYGFCSTDHYCKTGDECKDGSFSCAPQPLFAPGITSGVRDVPPQAEDAPIELTEKTRASMERKFYICSKDRASVLECAYGFCATD